MARTNWFETFKVLKNEVCKCCKEIGHSAERCDNDPNFHTTKSNLEEMEL